MRKYLFALVLVVALVAISIPAEAQVVVYDTNGTVVYGIPAQPGPIANGAVRHYNNGYVGVNYRHGSRLPMTWGTGPVMATGPIVSYRPYYGPAYIARRPCGGGFVHGGAVVHPIGVSGTRGFITGGVSGPGWSVGGAVGW